MPKWTKQHRRSFNIRGRVIPASKYDQLTLANDTFRLEIHEDDEELGTYYAYFVRMSGPLVYSKNKKELHGTDKKQLKYDALVRLQALFDQASSEIAKMF